MKSPWKETFAGRQVNFTDPDPADICIEDIAHSLARTCRYGGHCCVDGIYSVAEHSLVVEHYLDEHYRTYRLRLLGLLHDAPEAYTGDLPPQMKALLPEYRRWELNCERAIWKAFGIHPLGMGEAERVKEADRAALASEAAAMMFSKGAGWECNTATGNLPHIAPDELPIYVVENKFLRCFQLLMRACALPVPKIDMPLEDALLEDALDVAEAERRLAEPTIPHE